MTAWIGPLVQAGVAIVQALEGARATAGEAERAEIDRALATIRGTDTRATARHDADLAVRLTRGGVSVPVALAPTEPPPSPFDDAVEGRIDPGGGLLAAGGVVPSAVRLVDLPPELRARVLAYVRAEEPSE